MIKLKTLNIDDKKFSSKDLEIIKNMTTNKRDKFLNMKVFEEYRDFRIHFYSI